MRWLASVSLWMMLASVGFCQQTPPQQAPTRIVRSATAALPPSSDAASASRVNHLLQAAKHLAQAGLNEDAAEYRRRAGQDQRAVYARIEQLKSEIEDLRVLSSAGVQVLAELKIIEIDQGELEASGLGEALSDAPLRGLPDSVRDAVRASQQLANRNTPHPAASMFGIFDSDSSVLGKLKAMCKDKRVKVIAEPKIVTVSGRKAELKIGGNRPIRTLTDDGETKTEQRFVGTRWTLLPWVKAGGKLRLQMSVSVSRLDLNKITSADPPVPSPLRKLGFATTVKMLDGQTAVMSSPMTLKAGNGAQRLMTLTLVTARIITPMGD